MQVRTATMPALVLYVREGEGRVGGKFQCVCVCDDKHAHQCRIVMTGSVMNPCPTGTVLISTTDKHLGLVACDDLEATCRTAARQTFTRECSGGDT